MLQAYSSFVWCTVVVITNTSRVPVEGEIKNSAAAFQLDHLEDYGRRHSLRSHGQVETAGEPETVKGLTAKVISLAANMGVTLKPDITISHRLPARAADRQVCAEEHKSKHDVKHASEASGRCARTQVGTACTSTTT